jgi:hypothetical protein
MIWNMKTQLKKHKRYFTKVLEHIKVLLIDQSLKSSRIIFRRNADEV